MKALMQKLFLSCEKATALMEQAEEEGISPKQRFQLKMHTAMCAVCRNYQRVSRAMEQLLESWGERVPEDGREMPLEKKEALYQALRDRSGPER